MAQVIAHSLPTGPSPSGNGFRFPALDAVMVVMAYGPSVSGTVEVPGWVVVARSHEVSYLSEALGVIAWHTPTPQELAQGYVDFDSTSPFFDGAHCFYVTDSGLVQELPYTYGYIQPSIRFDRSTYFDDPEYFLAGHDFGGVITSSEVVSLSLQGFLSYQGQLFTGQGSSNALGTGTVFGTQYAEPQAVTFPCAGGFDGATFGAVFRVDFPEILSSDYNPSYFTGQYQEYGEIGTATDGGEITFPVVPFNAYMAVVVFVPSGPDEPLREWTIQSTNPGSYRDWDFINNTAGIGPQDRLNRVRAFYFVAGADQQETTFKPFCGREGTYNFFVNRIGQYDFLLGNIHGENMVGRADRYRFDGQELWNSDRLGAHQILNFCVAETPGGRLKVFPAAPTARWDSQNIYDQIFINANNPAIPGYGGPSRVNGLYGTTLYTVGTAGYGVENVVDETQPVRLMTREYSHQVEWEWSGWALFGPFGNPGDPPLDPHAISFSLDNNNQNIYPSLTVAMPLNTALDGEDDEEVRDDAGNVLYVARPIRAETSSDEESYTFIDLMDRLNRFRPTASFKKRYPGGVSPQQVLTELLAHFQQEFPWLNYAPVPVIALRGTGAPIIPLVYAASFVPKDNPREMETLLQVLLKWLKPFGDYRIRQDPLAEQIQIAPPYWLNPAPAVVLTRDDIERDGYGITVDSGEIYNQATMIHQPYAFVADQEIMQPGVMRLTNDWYGEESDWPPPSGRFVIVNGILLGDGLTPIFTWPLQEDLLSEGPITITVKALEKPRQMTGVGAPYPPAGPFLARLDNRRTADQQAAVWKALGAGNLPNPTQITLQPGAGFRFLCSAQVVSGRTAFGKPQSGRWLNIYGFYDEPSRSVKLAVEGKLGSYDALGVAFTSRFQIELNGTSSVWKQTEQKIEARFGYLDADQQQIPGLNSLGDPRPMNPIEIDMYAFGDVNSPIYLAEATKVLTDVARAQVLANYRPRRSVKLRQAHPFKVRPEYLGLNIGLPGGGSGELFRFDYSADYRNRSPSVDCELEIREPPAVSAKVLMDTLNRVITTKNGRPIALTIVR